MKHLTIILMSLMLMTAAKCQGLKECPKTEAEWSLFKKATLGNVNREEGLKNFKKLVRTTKIANCKRPTLEEDPLINTFGYFRTRASGNRGVGEWDEYYEEMVRHLFKLNVDLHAVDNHPGRLKAMHAACNGNSVEFLKLLLELGADPNTFSITVSGRKRTVLEVCNAHHSSEGVRTLLQTGELLKADICDNYWQYTDKRILRIYREFGWNDDICPIDG